MRATSYRSPCVFAMGCYGRSIGQEPSTAETFVVRAFLASMSSCGAAAGRLYTLVRATPRVLIEKQKVPAATGLTAYAVLCTRLEWWDRTKRSSAHHLLVSTKHSKPNVLARDVQCGVMSSTGCETRLNVSTETRTAKLDQVLILSIIPEA